MLLNNICMKASGKVNPEKKASFKKTSNFINNFTFQLFNKVYPSFFIIVNQNLMNSEPAKVEICFHFILGKTENKAWPYHPAFTTIIWWAFSAFKFH